MSQWAIHHYRTYDRSGTQSLIAYLRCMSTAVLAAGSKLPSGLPTQIRYDVVSSRVLGMPLQVPSKHMA
jgi:hypothetical protein